MNQSVTLVDMFVLAIKYNILSELYLLTHWKINTTYKIHSKLHPGPKWRISIQGVQTFLFFFLFFEQIPIFSYFLNDSLTHPHQAHEDS